MADASTRQQMRAALAAKNVQSVKSGAEALGRKYNSRAQKLPVLLKTNGLLQTVAFLESKAKRAETKRSPDSEAAGRVVDHLENHLIEAGMLKTEEHLLRATGEEGHDVLLHVGFETLLSMQEEAIACASWTKRFAAAVFGDPDDDAGTGG